MRALESGVKLDRRVRQVDYTGEDNRGTGKSASLYRKEEAWVDELLDELFANFDFGRVDIDADRNIVAMNAKASKLLGTRFFGQPIPLNKVIPDHIEHEEHDSWVADWVGSKQIVRPLGESKELRVTDHTTKETRMIRIMLMRVPSSVSVATAVLLEPGKEVVQTGQDGFGVQVAIIFERISKAFERHPFGAKMALAGIILIGFFALSITIGSTFVYFFYTGHGDSSADDVLSRFSERYEGRYQDLVPKEYQQTPKGHVDLTPQRESADEQVDEALTPPGALAPHDRPELANV